MYTWSCNECETRLWSRERVPGGGSCPACGAWLSQTAAQPPRPLRGVQPVEDVVQGDADALEDTAPLELVQKLLVGPA